MQNKIISAPETVRVKKFKKSQTQLTDEQALTLLFNDNNDKECEEIDLSYNMLGDALAIQLADNNQAAIINLSYNHIHDDGARCLAKCGHIHTLYLSGNPVGDSGMQAFLDNHTIQQLYFYKCNLSVEMQEALWKHLEKNRAIASCKRQLFFQTLMVLLNDHYHRGASESFISWLPTEIFIKILASIEFSDLGIVPSQGNAFLKFVFDNKDQIVEKLENKSGVKIEIDPLSRWQETANNRYRFYQPAEQPPTMAAPWYTIMAPTACSIQ